MSLRFRSSTSGAIVAMASSETSTRTEAHEDLSGFSAQPVLKMSLGNSVATAPRNSKLVKEGEKEQDRAAAHSAGRGPVMKKVKLLMLAGFCSSTLH